MDPFLLLSPWSTAGPSQTAGSLAFALSIAREELPVPGILPESLQIGARIEGCEITEAGFQAPLEIVEAGLYVACVCVDHRPVVVVERRISIEEVDLTEGSLGCTDREVVLRQAQVGTAEVWILFEGALESLSSFFVVTSGKQSTSQVVVGAWKLRLQTQCFAGGLDGAIGVRGSLVGEAPGEIVPVA